MENKNISIERLGIKSGIWVCFAFIAYFMFMYYLNLATIAELRLVNALIMLTGIILTLRYYKSRTGKTIDYLGGIALSFLTSVVSVILFSTFIYTYFSKINPTLLMLLKNNAPMMGQYLTPFSAALTVMIEGTISGLIISFAIMQYYKDDPNKVKQDQKIHQRPDISYKK